MADERGRDRSIEHILRRGAAGPRPPAAGSCVDGEALAAWSSGALDRLEAARVEEHLADCARCQSMLAAFVRTAPPAATPAPWWRRAQMRWLVPLATAATVAAIWVALPPREIPVAPPVEMRERADAEKRFANEPPSSRPVETAPGAAQNAAPKPKPQDSSKPLDSLEPRAKTGDSAARQSGRGAANEQAAAAPPAAPPPPPSVAESVAVRAESPQLMARVAGLEIVSPGDVTRWRIVGGSQVQRSTTQGASWEAVTLPSDRTLTAGHSPAASVAWLVGKAGAIFVTADGARFEHVPFVSSADLASVVAVDDRQATVTTLDGRRFRTADRGRTWSSP